METMKKLCKQFERMHPGYSAFLDEIASCKGYYRVCIDSYYRYPQWYTFSSCSDFSAWMRGVILD